MKYQVMRDLTQTEYEDLKQSIIENGVIVPIIVDENGDIIDGHHRVKICEELGLTDFPTERKDDLTEEEKINMAYQLNEARRQLSAEEKRQEIKRRLQEAPEISDRQIAKQVDSSPTTVGTIRKVLEDSGQLSKLDSSIGADGKERPRQVERKPVDPPPEEEPADIADTEDYDENQIDIEETFEEFGDEDTPKPRIFNLVKHEKQKIQEEEEKDELGEKKYKELEKPLFQINTLKFEPDDYDAIIEHIKGFGKAFTVDDVLDDIARASKKLKEFYTNIYELNTKGKFLNDKRKNR